MKDQSHKDEMSAAIRGDFQRLRDRGVAATLAPHSERTPDDACVESTQALSPPVAPGDPSLAAALEPRVEDEPVADAEPEREAQAEPEPEPEPERERAAQAEPVAQAEPEPEPERAAQAEPEPEREAVSEARMEMDAGPDERPADDERPGLLARLLGR